MFGNMIQGQLNTIDLNKDGIPDKQQAEVIVALAQKAGDDLKKAGDDLHASVDWKAAAEANELIKSGINGILAAGTDEAKQLTEAIAKHDFDSAIDALRDAAKDPAIKANLGKCLVGAVQLSGTVDQAKLGVAFADLKVAAEDLKKVGEAIEAYAHPPEKKDDKKKK